MEETKNQIPGHLRQDISTQETTKTIPSRYNGKSIEEIEIDEKSLNNTGQAIRPKGLDFDECVQYLNKKGKEQYGNHFAIHPADYEIIFKLLVYAVKDQKNATKLNINLGKGILLSGPVGCGKTTLMSLLNQFQPKEAKHVMKTCREISFDFIKDGYDTIHKYSTHSFGKLGNENWPRIYCFDDLGTENSLKYYGNECNVMAEILLSRYELFIQKKMLTHLTTNLSAMEIEEIYGSRVRSRMREMFNLIAFGAAIKDKRR